MGDLSVRYGLEILMKRDELIHPEICGNKWRKLKYHLLEAEKADAQCLVSFGGAYSNHLLALAKCGSILGVTSLGYIRSYSEVDNPTTRSLKRMGMKLRFVEPRAFNALTSEHQFEIEEERGSRSYVIPFGGLGAQSAPGVHEMLREIPDSGSFSHVICSVGTGATLRAIADFFKGSETKVLGITPFRKRINSLPALSNEELSKDQNITLIPSSLSCRFGGMHPELIHRIKQFYDREDIQLDPVYTGKMIITLDALVKDRYFPEGSKLLVIHTGGLQGIPGFEERHEVDMYG